MNEIKDVIVDIRLKLEKKAFKDEQHVRFSLVGRICSVLGWNIWDPEEFYTEYRVKKFPPQDITVDLRGRVDVALILTEKMSDIAEVFIEIKAPGKLQKELSIGETQLQRYNYWDKSAVSILTDGIVWRFYLPSAGGAFESTLFNEVNILEDNLDLICQIFNQILKRENYRKQAMQIAEDMLDERRIILIIGKVKQEAERLATQLGLSKFLLAQQLIKTQVKKEISIEDIERLWAKKYKAEIEVNPDPEPVPSGDNLKLYISKNGVRASGLYDFDTNKFILLKGSEIIKDHKPTFVGLYLNLKKDMISDGRLYLDLNGTKYVLKDDYCFSAPSPASYLVLGRSSSGFVDWVDENGKTLNEYRNERKLSD